MAVSASLSRKPFRLDKKRRWLFSATFFLSAGSGSLSERCRGRFGTEASADFDLGLQAYVL